MALTAYNAKRRFDVSPEPRGTRGDAQGNAFVVQKHAARRLHYDLRLELGGVMLSWAVTRGPSLVPGDKRLAVQVEDHPIAYNAFEGVIPAGQYGGGTVMIWDRGTWLPEGDPRKGYKSGNLDFRLSGEKLKGRWRLVRMKKREDERQVPWLLIKAQDEEAREAGDEDILEAMSHSVASGRSMEEIAAGTPARKHPPKQTSARRASVKEASAKEASGEKASPAGNQSATTRTARTADGAAKTASGKAPAPAAKTAKAAEKRAVGKAAPPRKAAAAKRARARALDARSAVRTTRAKADPMPDFVAPCLARLSEKAPDADLWLHEIKFDGYRMQARLSNGDVRLRTRTGLDWTERFRPVAKALEKLPMDAALIDGEIVVETDTGVSSFGALQDALKGDGGAFVFYVFDLLHCDGRDLRSEPLEARKARLEEAVARLPEARGTVRYSEHFDSEGSLLLDHACRLTLEGIISKRRDAPYRSGRTGDWIKTKCSDRQEFVVAGFAPATGGAQAVGSLVVGYQEDGHLRYAGRVGTGYSDRTARDLWRRLDPLRVERAPFGAVPAEERRRLPVWVRPQLVVEVDFRGWTGEGRLRHAAFKGLREDKRAADVVREGMAMKSASESSATKTSATGTSDTKTSASSTAVRRAEKKSASRHDHASPTRLTNPDRVYWEDVGLTKQGLADYYAAVRDWIGPHVTGRVLSLVRCPEGADGQCFFQKHATAGLDARNLRLVPEDGGEVIAIDDLAGLIALVQAGTLEIHVRGSRIDRLDAADRLVFDLDPGPETGWADVRQAARAVRERLGALGLDAFLKTTGGKGLHVVAPISPTPWAEVKAFTRSVAEAMAADEPERYVAVAAKRARTGRIFIDYLRNSREATAVCAYSTRARPGAPVSVPIGWSELGRLTASDRYTVGNLMQRLRKRKADPWPDWPDRPPKLPAALKLRAALKRR